jgi:TolB-like protein
MLKRHPWQRHTFIPWSLILVYVTISFFMYGCSRFNGTRAENILGKETDLIQFSYRAAEELAATASPPLIPQHPEMPLLITTFVDNNDLTKTSQFGRILQEQMSSRFVQLGYTVREIKLANTLHIEEQSGETILSRDLKKLSGSQKAQAIVVGTVSYANRTMYVSARLVNPNSSTIIASADYRLCMDDHILAMFGLQRSEEPEMIAAPHKPFLNSIF